MFKTSEETRKRQRERQKIWYKNNKERVREKHRKYREEKKKEKDAYKSTLHCVICGEKEICCLEFHHLDPSKKEITIGYFKNINSEIVQKEIAKCIVLCSNCHRKVHAGILSITP